MWRFIKLKLILTLFVTAAAIFIAADSKLVLKIHPIGDVFVRPLGGSIMFTCEVSPREEQRTTTSDLLEGSNSTDTGSYDANYLMTISDIAETSHVTSHLEVITGSHLEVVTDLISSQSIAPSLTNANDSIRVNVTKTEQPILSNPSSHNVSAKVVEYKSTLHWLDKDKFEIRPRRTPISRPVYVEEEETTDDKKYKKLYISSIQNQHAGEYRCIERGYDDVILQSAAVILRLYRRIQFDQGSPSVVITSLSGVAFLPCKATGYPMPIVTWRFNGSRIVTKSSGRLVQTTGGLRIENVTKYDVGVYQCRAVVESSGDYEEKIVELLVRARPEFTTDIGEVIGIKTQELFIQCTATGGVPAPKYSLFRNDDADIAADSDELLDSQNWRIRIDADTGLITIREVQLSDDRSQYVCVVNNELGEARTRIVIVVHEIPHIATFDSITVIRSESGSFLCESPVLPTPNITFHRITSQPAHLISITEESSADSYDFSNAQEFVYGHNASDRVFFTLNVSGSAILNIANISSEDAGVYSCTATNKYGIDRRLGRLNVVYSPAMVSLTPSSVYLAPRGFHNFTCIVDSNPLAEISWIHLNETLRDNDIVNIHSTDGGSILTLETGLSSSYNESSLHGIYTCLASNEYGRSQLDTEVLEATVPPAPSNVSVSEYTTSSVELRVTSPDWDGGLPLTGYQVQYEEIQHTYKCGSIIIINDLQPNTSYTMDIRAINELGAGRQHISINVTTKEIDINYEIAASHNDATNGMYNTWRRTHPVLVVLYCSLQTLIILSVL